MKIGKHKKKLTAMLVLGVAAAICIPFLVSGEDVEETVREREYTATRGTITVGVESSGLVETGPNAHSFEAGTVVEELLVKVGSEVKKGEPLAVISTENLKELIEAAQEELSNAKAAALQATSDKDVLIAQNNKDKEQGLERVEQEYQSQKELLKSEKNRIEGTIAQQEKELEQLRQQITDSSAQVGDLEEKIQGLKTKINQNILEIGRLNEELIQAEGGAKEQGNSQEQEEEGEITSQEMAAEQDLLPAASQDPNAIRLRITELQNENTAMQQEIDGYMADPAFEELERLKGERQTCEDSLKSNYAALSLKKEELERAEKQYQQALENQNEDNAFSDYKTSEEVKSIDQAIAKATRNLQEAQEKVNHLNKLYENPVVYAQMDGVVTALNYKAGDTIVEGKPLCVVGNLDQITMTVPVSAADIGSVSVGQKVNIYLDAYAEQKFVGKVTERLLVANDNGEYPVTITIEPGEQMLLPGMKGYATIILKEKVDVLTLSNKAITLENGRQYVLVRDERGELVQKEIVTGFSDGRVSEILDGLAENEVVIVRE